MAGKEHWMKGEKKPTITIIKESRILILFLFLIPWAFLFNKLESHIYPFFILIFFILSFYLFKIRKANYSILIIPIVLLILISTRSLNAIDKIKSTIQLLSKDPASSMNELFTPNTGQGVIGEPLIWMNSAIKENDLIDYKFSTNLEGDQKIKQRMIEFSWPAKFEPDSMNMFIENDELNSYPLCTLVDQSMEYSLVRCN